jgi:protein O-GlcNAc transferase
MKPAEINSLLIQGIRKQEAGDNRGAETLFRRVLKADRSHPEACFRLGLMADMEARYRDAVALFEKAVSFSPLNEEYQLALANSCQAAGRYAEAEAIFLKYYCAEGDTPSLRLIAYNLINLYYVSAQIEKSTAYCDAAISRFGDDDMFLLQRGRLLARHGDLDASIAVFETVARRGQNTLSAMLAMLPVFNEKGAYGAYVKRADAIPSLVGNPVFCADANNAYLHMGRLEDAIGMMRTALAAFPKRSDLHSALIRAISASDVADEKDVYECAARWGQKFDNPQDRKPFAHYKNGSSDGRRLRLGILSKTFRQHATMTILRPLMPELAKYFDLYGYYDDVTSDGFTEMAKNACKEWRVTAMLTEADAAKLIYDDALDVLIDISGHFNASRPRILSYRPAPVIIHYADSSCSLGIKAVGYRFSDALSEPPERGDPYSFEKVLRLPHGFFLYEPFSITPEPGPCPADTNGFVTFGSCSALHKITSTTLALWKSALDAVPGSRFILARHEFANDPDAVKYWLDRFEKSGMARERIKVEGRDVAYFEEMRFYNEIDVALDTFPYSGVTTTLDAMWSGVPMVTYRETRLINRMGSAFITRVGLGDLIVEDKARYGVVVACLSADADRRRELRRTLRQRMRASPLCDAAGMAVDMKNAIDAVLAERRK